MNTPEKLGLCVEKTKTWRWIKLSTINLEKLPLKVVSGFENSFYFFPKISTITVKMFNLNQI